MSNPEQSISGPEREEALLLIENSLRGQISAEDSRRLEVWLAQPECMKQYVEYVFLTVSLGVWASALNEAGDGGDLSPPLPCVTEVKESSVESTSTSESITLSNSLSTPQQEVTVEIETRSASERQKSSATLRTLGNFAWGGVAGPGLLRTPFILTFLLLGAFAAGWISRPRVASDLILPLEQLRTEISPSEAVNDALSARTVAFLTSANGCDWGDPSKNIWQVGRNVNVGDELALHEGIAEFHLASGVALSIEGPAAVVMNSPTSLVVQYGKISAHVPWTVTDFKVLASTCRINACDAEFGVKITGSEVEIHAFTGEVIVGSSPFELLTTDRLENELDISEFRRHEKDLPSGSEFVEACVSKGRALRLMGGHNGMKILRWQRAKEIEFTTKLSMAGSLYVSDNYVNAVRESKPVAYWRFETLANGRIPSEVSPANDLCIVGKMRLVVDGDGRVVEFGRPGGEGHLVSSEPLNALAASDYSTEVWFKSSHVHRGGLIGLAVNQHLTPNQVGPTNGHAFFLETVGTLVTDRLRQLGLNDSGRLRFLHRDPPGSSPQSGTSCFSANPYTPRRWQQLVAVKEGSTMRLYLNGDLTGTSEDPTSLARELYLEVGQVIGIHKVVPFIGQMDELSVYNRALSEKEIKQHYKAMNSGDKKPKQKQTTEA